MPDLDPKVATLDDVVAAVNSINASVAGLTSTVANLPTSAGDADFKAVSDDVASLSARIDTLGNTLGAIGSTVTSHTTEIDSLNSGRSAFTPDQISELVDVAAASSEIERKLNIVINHIGIDPGAAPVDAPAV